MTLQINSDHVNTKQGVPISCIGVAQVKVESRQEQMLSTACTHFLGKSEETIQSIALETMEGHQRAIMGQMTVEEIYQDRKAFSVKESGFLWFVFFADYFDNLIFNMSLLGT